MQWRYLSAVEEKRRHYAREPYFRESMRDAESVLGPQALSILQRVALVVVKPEALVGARVEAIVEFLSENRFTPVYVGPFSFTRHIVRELWRFQWNAATIEKMDLGDRVNCSLPTAILLLRDDEERRVLPAAVRLKTLKGHAVPARRDASSLRAALATPNRMLTFVHTADEPADVVRELGVFFDRARRRTILSELRDGMSRDLMLHCRRELTRLEADAPRSDFDPDAAWVRILDRADPSTHRLLSAQRELYRRAGTVDWYSFASLCTHAGADEWDIIAIGAAAIEHEDAGQAPLLAFDESGVDGWRTGGAALWP